MFVAEAALLGDGLRGGGGGHQAGGDDGVATFGGGVDGFVLLADHAHAVGLDIGGGFLCGLNPFAGGHEGGREGDVGAGEEIDELLVAGSADNGLGAERLQGGGEGREGLDIAARSIGR